MVNGWPREQASNGATGVDAARRQLRIVALGGGTGLPVVLEGLKRSLFDESGRGAWARERDRLTAIVTMADDGGSSGRLRRAYQVPPPGDVRNCLLALSARHSQMTPLFRFRFGGQGDVGGHSLGNLILSALNELEGDFCEAVEQAGRMLETCGRILPTTLTQVRLRADFEDGSSVEGESRIAQVGRRVRRVWLQPADARVLPEAAAAIEAADLIVIGPGSLYTSLIPIFLVRSVVEAVAHSKGRVVLVMNLMTQPGETDGYTAVDHVLAIRRHAPKLRIDDVLINTAPISESARGPYSAERATPVSTDCQILQALGYRALDRDLLAGGEKIRHDPDKLAHAVLTAATHRGAYDNQRAY